MNEEPGVNMNEEPGVVEQPPLQDKKADKENVWLNLILNLVLPTIILVKMSDEARLGPVVALAFPVCYGIYDLLTRRKVNFVSVLGLVSLLLTGVIGLIEISTRWLAVKEAAIPFIIGVAVLFSLKTRYPLVKTLLYNDKIIKVDVVEQHLYDRKAGTAFEKLLQNATRMLASSFFLSSLLNYILARVLVVSESGTPQFNQELGKMMMYSYPVIVVPSMIVMVVALWYLLHGIKKLTGMDLEEIFKT
jgi:hypothetical protein